MEFRIFGEEVAVIKHLSFTRDFLCLSWDVLSVYSVFNVPLVEPRVHSRFPGEMKELSRACGDEPVTCLSPCLRSPPALTFVVTSEWLGNAPRSLLLSCFGTRASEDGLGGQCCVQQVLEKPMLRGRGPAG